MMTLKHVLVATDFGEAADTALIDGREVARSFGATLHVLHVIEDFAARHDEVDRVLGGVAHDLRRRRPDLAARRGVPPEAIRLIQHGAEAPADAALPSHRAVSQRTDEVRVHPACDGGEYG